MPSACYHETLDLAHGLASVAVAPILHGCLHTKCCNGKPKLRIHITLPCHVSENLVHVQFCPLTLWSGALVDVVMGAKAISPAAEAVVVQPPSCAVSRVPCTTGAAPVRMPSTEPDSVMWAASQAGRMIWHTMF
jgi:hypothetical protein